MWLAAYMFATDPFFQRLRSVSVVGLLCIRFVLVLVLQSPAINAQTMARGAIATVETHVEPNIMLGKDAMQRVNTQQSSLGGDDGVLVPVLQSPAINAQTMMTRGAIATAGTHVEPNIMLGKNAMQRVKTQQSSLGGADGVLQRPRRRALSTRLAVVLLLVLQSPSFLLHPNRSLCDMGSCAVESVSVLNVQTLFVVMISYTFSSSEN